MNEQFQKIALTLAQQQQQQTTVQTTVQTAPHNTAMSHNNHLNINRDLNNSGVFNLGDIHGDINNRINELPKTTPQQDQLKNLLIQLQTEIQAHLDPAAQEDALPQLQTLTKVAATPHDPTSQSRAKRAINFLKDLTTGISLSTTAVEGGKTLLTAIAACFGL